jgi:membrane protease YdiL (CAAX protease family)
MQNNKQLKAKWGPLAAVVATIVIYFASQVIGTILILAVAKARGWDQAQINHWVQQTFPQFIYIVLVEGVTLLMLWRFLRRRHASFRDLSLRRPKVRDASYVLLGALIYFPILVAVMAGIQAWLPQINLNQAQEIGFNHTQGPALVLAFVSLVVLPPVTEEILVRGFLYGGLKSKLPKIWAALVTSLLFGAAHLEFGSGAPLLWSAAIDTFILSMVLVYLREKTGSLWASIGLHMTKNAIAFGALFLFIK